MWGKNILPKPLPSSVFKHVPNNSKARVSLTGSNIHLTALGHLRHLNMGTGMEGKC